MLTYKAISLLFYEIVEDFQSHNQVEVVQAVCLEAAL